MNLKKILRVAIPAVSGAVAAGIAILLTRPTEPVEPGYDVPTDDEPPFHVDPKPEFEVIPVPRQRKPKTS